MNVRYDLTFGVSLLLGIGSGREITQYPRTEHNDWCSIDMIAKTWARATVLLCSLGSLKRLIRNQVSAPGFCARSLSPETER